MKHKCLVCGEPTHLQYKFKHGTVWLCYRTSCHSVFSLKVDRAVPVVWVGDEDILSHELLPKSLLDKIPDSIKAAVYAEGDCLWDDDTMGELFGEALRVVAEHLEREYIYNVPRQQLPLMIGNLHFENNNEALQRHIGEKK